MKFTEIHSFSGLDKFFNCPTQYNEIKVLKNWKDDFSSKSALEGNRVHKLLEEAFRWKERSCSDKNLNKAISKVWRNIDNLGMKHGDSLEPYIETELGLGVLQDLKTTCDFWDKQGGFRGKMDLLAMAGKVAYIVDWKTGNPQYAKMDQLESMAYLAKMKWPHIEAIFLELVFPYELKGCRHQKIVTNDEWVEQFHDELSRKINRLEGCRERDEWFAQPNGLCKNYCPVKSCIHNGGYTG